MSPGVRNAIAHLDGKGIYDLSDGRVPIPNSKLDELAQLLRDDRIVAALRFAFRVGQASRRSRESAKGKIEGLAEEFHTLNGKLPNKKELVLLLIEDGVSKPAALKATTGWLDKDPRGAETKRGHTTLFNMNNLTLLKRVSQRSQNPKIESKHPICPPT